MDRVSSRHSTPRKAASEREKQESCGERMVLAFGSPAFYRNETPEDPMIQEPVKIKVEPVESDPTSCIYSSSSTGALLGDAMLTAVSGATERCLSPIIRFCPSPMDLHDTKMGSMNKLFEEKMEGDPLTSWTTKHPLNWSKREVLDWLYYVVEQENLDGSRVKGEAYRNFSGADLVRMSREEFLQADPEYGLKMYQMFRHLVNDVLFEAPKPAPFPVSLDMFNYYNHEHSSQLAADICNNVIGGGPVDSAHGSTAKCSRLESAHHSSTGALASWGQRLPQGAARGHVTGSGGAISASKSPKSLSEEAKKDLVVYKTGNDVEVDLPCLGVYSICTDIEFPASSGASSALTFSLLQASSSRLSAGASFTAPLTPPSPPSSHPPFGVCPTPSNDCCFSRTLSPPSENMAAPLVSKSPSLTSSSSPPSSSSLLSSSIITSTAAILTPPFAPSTPPPSSTSPCGTSGAFPAPWLHPTPTSTPPTPASASPQLSFMQTPFSSTLTRSPGIVGAVFNPPTVKRPPSTAPVKLSKCVSPSDPHRGSPYPLTATQIIPPHARSTHFPHSQPLNMRQNSLPIYEDTFFPSSLPYHHQQPGSKLGKSPTASSRNIAVIQPSSYERSNACKQPTSTFVSSSPSQTPGSQKQTTPRLSSTSSITSSSSSLSLSSSETLARKDATDIAYSSEDQANSEMYTSPMEEDDGDYNDLDFDLVEMPDPTKKCPRKKLASAKTGNHLWEFVRDLLQDPKTNPRLLKWEDKENGVFRFVQSEQVAKLWGQKKNNPQMTYEKLSRAMRFCRKAGYFHQVPKNGKFPKKLCFMFGSKAHGWKD